MNGVRHMRKTFCGKDWFKSLGRAVILSAALFYFGSGCAKEEQKEEVRYGIDGKPGDSTGKTLEELIRATTQGEPKDRSYAIQVLGKIGPAANTAIPAIKEQMKDKADVLRLECAVALVNLGQVSQDVADVLCALLKSQQMEIQAQAAATLGRIGAKAAPAIPDLVNCLAGFGKEVKDKAAATLQSIGAPAYGPLVDAMKIQREDLAGRTVSVLGAGGPRYTVLEEAVCARST